MRKSQDQNIREVRHYLAAAIQGAISAITPYVEADARGKKWSAVDRMDACEDIDQLRVAVTDAHNQLVKLLGPAPRQAGKPSESYKQKRKGLSAGENQRLNRIMTWMKLAAAEARSVTPEAMHEADERYRSEQGREKARLKGKTRALEGRIYPHGQLLFIYKYRVIMMLLRRSLANMFYLVRDARIKTIKLTADEAEEYFDPRWRDLATIKLEHRAREMAHKTGNFVEVEVTDPSTGQAMVVFDASPHAATVRKEMGVAQRPEKRAFPYVANPKSEIDTLISLYEMF